MTQKEKIGSNKEISKKDMDKLKLTKEVNINNLELIETF